MLILDDQSYIEAVFKQKISLDDLYKVRIRKQDYTDLWDLAFKNFGKKLGIAEKSLVHDFTDIIKANNKGIIKLEVST